jgi:hypothetical protein
MVPEFDCSGLFLAKIPNSKNKEKISDLVLLAVPQKSNFISLFFSPSPEGSKICVALSHQNVKASKCQVIKVAVIEAASN